MNITYSTTAIPTTQQVIDVYESSGINRPTKDFDRIAKMYAHANLIASAWDGERLVGVARSLTDFCYCCYLSDLAVANDYKKAGIGKKLIALSKEAVGEQTTLILFAAPAAMEYYPKIGMDAYKNGFGIPRTK